MTHSFPARRFSDLSVVVEWPIIGRKADSSHFPSVKIMTSDVQQLFLLGSVREGRDRSPARRPARIARIGTAAALGAVGTTGRDRELHAPDCAQRVVMIDDTIADDVDELALLLKPSAPDRRSVV